MRWGLSPNDTEPVIPTKVVHWFVVPQGEEWALPLDLSGGAARGAWTPGVRFDATVSYQGPGAARYATRLLGTLKVSGDDAFVVEDARQDGDFAMTSVPIESIFGARVQPSKSPDSDKTPS